MEFNIHKFINMFFEKSKIIERCECNFELLHQIFGIHQYEEMDFQVRSITKIIFLS